MDKALLALMQQIMTDATIGKVKSVAEATYANFKGRMYVLYEADVIVGLMGLSRPTRGEAEILHFALIDSDERRMWIKAAFAELRESRRDLKILRVRADETSAALYKAVGFKIKNYPDNPYGLEGYLCTLKF